MPSSTPPGAPLWAPDAQRRADSAMEAFRRAAEAASGVALPDYFALHAWSVAQPAPFWSLLARELRLPFHDHAAEPLSADPMPHTRWFEGATLNYAEALLNPAGVSPTSPAIIAVGEEGSERRYSWAELGAMTAAARAALEAAGVKRGDAVAAFAANVPEAVVGLLASAAMGAVFTSCSPDFGVDAAAARFGQVAPKVLLATTEYHYGGRRYDVSGTVAALQARLPSVVVTVELPAWGEERGSRSGEARHGRVPWSAWLESGREAGGSGAAAPAYDPLPFDHPLYVLYSSGTTGAPKALVHRAGGALLTHRKEHALHSDIRPGDVVYYYTTTGWMMWNWLVSALASGATIVLYDGAAAYPDPLSGFRLAERLGVTFFGTSARFLQELQRQGAEPGRVADLGTLRTLASTGSPLSPQGFEYVYRSVKNDVHLASISGGTDIVSCFMLGVPTLPVHAGEIQAPGLGVDLRVLDDAGAEVASAPGELVCGAPLPSMPLRFMGDPDFARYEAAYFADYPGLWRHGDLVERTPNGGIVVYGRSDATLNPGGVRIGTAEIYRPLEALPEIVEAVAVAHRSAGDEEVWLLVVLRAGVVLDDALELKIRSTIRAATSPRHVPKRMVAVPDLPRTRSGKTMELAVSRLVNGAPTVGREVIANPEALDGVAASLRLAGLIP